VTVGMTAEKQPRSACTMIKNKININIIGTVPMVAGKKPTVPPLQPQPQRGSQATQLELQ
jgi:hypothetical protein